MKAAAAASEDREDGESLPVRIRGSGGVGDSGVSLGDDIEGNVEFDGSNKRKSKKAKKQHDEEADAEADESDGEAKRARKAAKKQKK